MASEDEKEDPYAERRKLTFAQAEGAEPLPHQLALKEVSPQMRSVLWSVVLTSLERCAEHGTMGGRYIREPWSAVLLRKHVVRDEKMMDDFSYKYDDNKNSLKQIFTHGDYLAIFGLLQWLLSQRERLINPAEIRRALRLCRSAYTLLDDGTTFAPNTSPEEGGALNRALGDLSASEFAGARDHLRKAAQNLTKGDYAGSIRESIHAVEAVARSLGGTDSLSGALQRLTAKHALHPALEKGFKSLYGYTCDTQGIRHPLVDEGKTSVDEIDAIFMLGACASFVSYLINRCRE